MARRSVRDPVRTDAPAGDTSRVAKAVRGTACMRACMYSDTLVGTCADRRLRVCMILFIALLQRHTKVLNYPFGYHHLSSAGQARHVERERERKRTERERGKLE
jgi:hypothetical protein